jgi:hypothetical protein
MKPSPYLQWWKFLSFSINRRAIAQNRHSNSAYFNQIDTTKIAVMGQSCEEAAKFFTSNNATRRWAEVAPVKEKQE